VFAALPQSVSKIYARADSGFYCWEAVEAYQSQGCQFMIPRAFRWSSLRLFQ
jgi:hypothetical protein